MRRALPLIALSLAACMASAAEPRTDELLARSGALLTGFVDEFSNVNCTELVAQAKLDKSGKVTARQEASFDYLLMLQIGADGMAIDESRLPKGEVAKSKGKSPLMASNGFATMFLVLHPYFQHSFRYEFVKEEVVNGKRLSQIAFRHVAGERTPAVLLLRGRQYPLSFAGTAWVENDTGAVVRVEATLADSLEDLGLKELHVDVQYAPLPLRDAGNGYLFPSTATVELATNRQRWRNQHRFVQYRQFSVSTDEQVKGPESK